MTWRPALKQEEGTEAAAALGDFILGSLEPPPPPPVFRADHPFVFLIRDRTTDAVLFMGRVADPRCATLGRDGEMSQHGGNG